MNDLIAKLYEEAIVVESCNDYAEGELDAEKFAELIVKACAQYVEDKFDFCGDEIWIAESLREHFEVEE